MQGYRIANFIIQSSYLTAHLLFLLFLYRERRPTPVWSWFFYLSAALWVWVSGRFMETIIYLFLPQNNDAYVFAANFQYIGNTAAVVCYVIWILYISGYDMPAGSLRFRLLLFACPVFVCTLVFSNSRHHLFYTKLVMGEKVGHGPLFIPCLVWVYLILLAGYAVSIRHVFKTRRDVIKQLLMFSLFPMLPALAVLVRSISGIDRLDYTPIIMTITIFCLYQIIFKYHYVHIVSASIREVIEQTAHPIGIYDVEKKKIEYVNQIASREYQEAAACFLPMISREKKRFEGIFAGRNLIIDVSLLPAGSPAGSSVLVTALDISENARLQETLDQQIRDLEQKREMLDEAKRNIDAYFDSLCRMEEVDTRQKMIAKTREMIQQTFRDVEANFCTARDDPGQADAALQENLRLTSECITAIRAAVSMLGENGYGYL